ncbi:MAG: restriction endonuclease subunit S [Halothiobacillaceae bacterium]|nr:restriction endonuclease subunit S [Halothiobacillaceae bacterium]
MSSKGASAMNEERKEKSALVPRLRFPEFRDAGEWDTPKLEDISVPVDERVGERKLVPVSISAGVGFVPQAEKFGRDISGNQYRLYTVVRDGDFVYNKGNSLKFPQGCVYDLQGWGEVAAPNVFICFRLKSGYENGFFRQCFEQNAHGLQLRKHITSGARSNGLLNISREAFFGVKIPTPKHAEQQKIAACLSSLDELITAETQKLDALKTHKKGLMQQLFPREGETVPRLRFPEFREAGEWEDKELGEISTVVASGDVDAAYFSPVKTNEHIYPVYSNAVEEQGLYGYYSVPKFPKGSVTITARGTLGVAFARSHEFMGIGRLLVVSNFKKIDPRFICECWNHLGRVPTEVTSIPQFTAVAAKATSLPIPAIEEQRRIADCLSSLDDLITAQSQKIDALKTHKKGMMQQLFPVLNGASA